MVRELIGLCNIGFYAKHILQGSLRDKHMLYSGGHANHRDDLRLSLLRIILSTFIDG